MRIIYLLLTILLSSCYPKIRIDGFSKEKWSAAFENCESSKVQLALLIIENENALLGKGQAEVKQLLGQPSEHELYRRNQKFFHYVLVPSDTCGNIKVQKNLSILFDALDRAKEVMISE